jgi:hypothetical protein
MKTSKNILATTLLVLCCSFGFAQRNANFQSTLKNAGTQLVNTATSNYSISVVRNANTQKKYTGTKLRATNISGVAKASRGKGTLLSGMLPNLFGGADTYELRLARKRARSKSTGK